MFSSTSLIGHDIDLAFAVITGICVLLFGVIMFFTLFFIFRYRKGRHPKAEDIEGNTALELSFLAVSIALVMAMFLWGWDGYRAIKGEAPEGSLIVKTTGQMWHWSFEYPDGTESDTLVIPYGKPVKLVISSRDVIHSFYIPAFRVKQDALPGAKRPLWFVPDEAGVFDVFCTEYCGTGHSGMLTKAVVLSEVDYEAWKKGEKTVMAMPGAAPSKAPSGKALYESKGCNACHSIDGTTLVGPSFKGLYGRKERVVTNGKEREVLVDDEYIRRSELTPNADVVTGFPPIMPPQEGVLKEEEIKALIEFIKGVK